MPDDPTPSPGGSETERGNEDDLLAAIKGRRTELEQLLDEVSGHWIYEDLVYRFWHQSFKVYYAQGETEKIVRVLRSLLPGRQLNAWFERIIAEGTGQKFEPAHNQDWLPHTRPILEAFFHSKFMLEMAVRYADLEHPPKVMPSGWAALLYLYGLR